MCEHVTLTEPALVQNLVLWHFYVQRRSVCVLAAVDPSVLCLSDGCCVWGYGPLRALLLSNLYVVLYESKMCQRYQTTEIKVKIRNFIN